MKKLGLFLLLLAVPAFSRGGHDPQVKAEDDPLNWKPVAIPGRVQPPEFDNIEKWINSDPLTIKKLKGKVVVVHFLTFGCINCKHNYPWYKATWKEFKDNKNFMMIGIQTPEEEEEKNVKQAEKAFKAAGLEFPIAVDNKKTMWQRYNNNMWPTVYLIDKQGIGRWRWLGELAWKGATGEEQMRKKILDLLAER